MQYVFFEKSIHSVQRDLGQSPRSCGIFENFCVKGNLTVCKVTLQHVRLLEPNSHRPHDAVGPSRCVGGVNRALHNTPSQK